MRRDRIAGSSSPSSVTVVHSHVARPLGPEKLHVISQMPGAASTSLTRKDFGHRGAPRASIMAGEPIVSSWERELLVICGNRHALRDVA